MIAQFSDMPGSSDSADSVADDHDMHLVKLAVFRRDGNVI
jgi:hypothetical protein